MLSEVRLLNFLRQIIKSGINRSLTCVLLGEFPVTCSFVRAPRTLQKTCFQKFSKLQPILLTQYLSEKHGIALNLRQRSLWRKSLGRRQKSGKDVERMSNSCQLWKKSPTSFLSPARVSSLHASNFSSLPPAVSCDMLPSSTPGAELLCCLHISWYARPGTKTQR